MPRRSDVNSFPNSGSPRPERTLIASIAPRQPTVPATAPHTENVRCHIVAQDKLSVTLRGLEGQTVRLPRIKIGDQSASPGSLMPEDQFKALSDRQVRDLFAYRISKRAPGK